MGSWEEEVRRMAERIGAGRSKGAYAFRTLKENGAVLIFGSDSPGANAARYFEAIAAYTGRLRGPPLMKTINGLFRPENWLISPFSIPI